MDVDGGNKRVFNRLGGDPRNQKVCYHWQAGKCNRHPCMFLHSEVPPHNSNGAPSKRTYGSAENLSFNGPPRRTSNFNTWGRGGGGRGGSGGRGGGRGGEVVKKAEKICNYWVQGNCSFGERCKFLHSWSLGDGFSLLTQLDGHKKVVSGIAFPSGSNKLYTGSTDETVRVWDCQSGQCTAVINLGGEVGCMISEGPWVFVGIPNSVKAWNTENLMELSLSGPVGQVYALVVINDMLFAGTQDGSILIWKFNLTANCFEPAASLKGHSHGVVSLVVGANRLYSGSMDNTIRVWSLETLQCLQTLTEHTSVVMSILCWDQFLLSCSLDKTVKVWFATESGNLEVTYTHQEEHGILTLCGMHDSQGKPILVCSCNDNTVHLYDLPSFAERGKIFTKQEVRAIQIGPGGIFFTGDGTGQVKVWNWIAEPTTSIQ
ncbi:PREDICTED: zinc finger CCCH domain-containing protein 48-like [Lupinus angustifolius]|uniref:zinc finger CCCH domain-containing protein 48-like n=1 Tax=Lupinus angustifolius TaxID=3871 RepID=UPI00092EDAA9|nr:PREDICTED: zinc finger CCCH domain-containing protein 48-like [Lupinus angustifolius]